MLYVCAPVPIHILANPEIVPGVAGIVFTVIAKVTAAEFPQVLFAVTVMFPLVALAVALILFVVDVPVQPPGNVQVYEVAPATAVIEYVFVVPEQMVAVPEIVPGVAGIVFTTTAKVCAVEFPHVLFAVTVIFPLVALAVALMLFVVDVPVQPPGNVHVYDVAPATAAIEYVFVVPEQIVAVPEIVPGVAGIVFTTTAKVCPEEFPQALFAVTVIFPLVALAVALIEFVVDVPVQPPGNVQV